MAPRGAICFAFPFVPLFGAERKELEFPMARSFPWSVTEDEFLLTNALASVMSTYEARGTNEETLVEEAAANLIIEAYNQGVRDEETLAYYALKILRQGRR